MLIREFLDTILPAYLVDFYAITKKLQIHYIPERKYRHSQIIVFLINLTGAKTMKTFYRKLAGIILALLLLILLPVVTASSGTKDSTISLAIDYPITRITDNIHVIYGPFSLPDQTNQGFRNNPVIIITDAGVVVCDPGGSASAGKMVLRKIKTITDKPVVAVFDSHAHGDHWLGNEAIKDAYPDAVIYGHAKMKSKVGSSDGTRWLDLINSVTKNTAKGTRVVNVDKTVKDGDEIKIGNLTFRVHHTGVAHTEGDIMVEIVEENALFLGDVVRNEFLGVMEEDSSFKGNIASIDYVLANLGNIKYYIPGHGKVSDTGMLTSYRDYLATLYDNVKMLYETGIADFEMKPRIVNNLSAFKKWEGFDLRVGPHISRAYLEVESENF